MLVLSRRADESIRFPNLGITIRVLRLSNSQARIGIESPPEIAVARGELGPEALESLQSRFPKQATQSLRKHLHDASTVLNKLHFAIESCDWQQAEPLVFSLFSELKSMDERVLALGGRAVPAVNRSRRVLLIDDNDNETRLLASYLRLKEIDVETARDGRDALDYLSRHAVPDVVVLDMNMPDHDGVWTLSRLRSMPQCDQMRIYAIGMDPDSHDLEPGPRGINRWFRKPLNPEDLIEQIYTEAKLEEASESGRQSLPKWEDSRSSSS